LKKLILVLTVLVVIAGVILLPGCTTKETTSAAPSTTTSIPAVTTTTQPSTSAPVVTTTTSLPTTRTITYYDGETVTVPYTITKVGSGWNAQNSIIAMLGFGDNIVATTDIIKASPNFAKFVPSIANAVICFNSNGDLNIESTVKADPDVAFIMKSGTAGAKFDALVPLGIPVVKLKDSSLQNLIDRTLITGQILGDAAYKKAQAYVEYYNNNVKLVQDRLKNVPQAQRVTVYLSSGKVLSTSGRPSLNQDWMDMAGVINVAENWTLAAASGDNANVEEIVASDPQVIICMNSADAKTILADPAWATIQAVKDGKVYTNPKGMFWWCRETTEEALQFLWVAKTVYPDAFKDIDMAKETKTFYKTFYGYDLTDDDVQLFLNPK
jgi:iron complex transport system substrate-binding protein